LEKTPVIYFIAEDDTNYVKIGYCKASPETRLQQLQVGNVRKLRIVASCEGTLGAETELHLRFKDSLVRGEWFRPTAELDAMIKTVGIQHVKQNRADVLVKDVSVAFWRSARLAAMERGVSMAAWLESIPKHMLRQKDEAAR